MAAAFRLADSRDGTVSRTGDTNAAPSPPQHGRNGDVAVKGVACANADESGQHAPRAIAPTAIALRPVVPMITGCRSFAASGA
jgi:hypothetical protein